MDDEKQVLEQARRLPLEERVDHKNWKVRSEALDHIKEQCTRARSSQDPIFAEAGKSRKAPLSAVQVEQLLDLQTAMVGSGHLSMHTACCRAPHEGASG